MDIFLYKFFTGGKFDLLGVILSEKLLYNRAPNARTNVLGFLAKISRFFARKFLNFSENIA